MLSNSNNVLITGGQFINSNTRIDGYQDGLEILRRHSALGALLDSNERFDPPRCAPDTRVAIINDILAWITNDDDMASMTWLYGPAGAGKSALAQSIAELCRKEKRLVASFFFSRTALNRSDGRLLIATLAYQLTLAFPATRNYIKVSIEADPTVFERSAETQMNVLVVDPLNRLASSWSTQLLGWVKTHIACFVKYEPRLIVIDGLDECEDSKIQANLLKTIGEAMGRLKLPIKFLIASRPESHLIHIFNHELSFQNDVSSVNLALDNEAHHDIRTLLKTEFNKIKRTHPLRELLPENWPGVDAIRRLVRKASGQFIYASTALKYIQSPKHRPDERLNVILGITPAPTHDAPFAQLDALYMHIFSSVDDIQTVLRIFSVLIIPRSKGDGLGSFTTPTTMERLLGLKHGDAQLLLGDLLSLVSLGGRDVPIKILHASIADYFLDPARSGKFRVDLGIAHSLLAIGYMKRASEIITAHSLNPAVFQTSMTPFIAHCEKAALTPDLRENLLHFDFAAICKTLVTRYKGWLVLNQYYIWFLIRTYHHIFVGETFKNAVELQPIHLEQLDYLNAFFVKQLKHNIVDDYLTILLSKIRQKKRFKRFTCSHVHRADETYEFGCLCRQTAIAVATAQYLALLCQLFYWDYNNMFLTDVHLRCADASKHCLKFLSVDLAENDFLHGKRLIRQFPTTRRSDYRLREAHLDCATVLLPYCYYLQDLVDYLADNAFTFSGTLKEANPIEIHNLTREIVSYLQRVETNINSNTLPYLKEKWLYHE